jgi:oligoendopeptidase F
MDGKNGAAEAYLTFLRTGGSRFPLETLNDAGVDMTTPEPVERAFQVLDGLVGRLEKLLEVS